MTGLDAPTLIGRDEAADLVADLVRRPDARLVTVTGRSGVGKSALVETVARSLEAEDGIGIVRAQVDRHTSESGAEQVRAALSPPTDGTAGPPPAGRRRVVLLDGLEAVAPSADLVAEALAADDGLTVLAASIVPLALPGERLVRLEPLALPAPDETSPTALRQAPAVRLLLVRIAEVTGCDHEPDLPPIVELARLLDGLPLAIELAAARCAELPVGDVLDQVRRLGPAAALRTDVPTDAQNRRGLRDTILWSYGLLDDVHQRALRRLAVFAGPFGRDAAATVTEADPDDLNRLIAVGLVRRAGTTPGDDLFELVPSVSAVGRELLAADDDLVGTEDRHAEHFLATARAAGLSLCSPAAPDVRRALLAGIQDLVAAVRHLHQRGRRADALELMVDLALLWEAPGAAAVATQLVSDLVAEDLDDTLDAGAVARLAALAVMVWGQRPVEDRAASVGQLDLSADAVRGDGPALPLLAVLRAQVASCLLDGRPDAGVTAAVEGLAAARTLADDWWTCQFLGWSASARTMCGDATTALADAIEGRDLALRTGDAAQLLRLSMLLVGIAGLRGESDASPLSTDELIALARRVDEPHAEGVLHVGRAVLDAVGGDVASGASHLVAALDVGRRRGLWYVEELTLFAAVVLAALGDRPTDAARLHGALTDVLPLVQRVVAPESTLLYEAAVERARTTLGDEEFERAVARGRMLDWEEATVLCAAVCDELAARPADAEPALDVDGPLSLRQVEVLGLLALGWTNKEIATELGLRPKTVMHHTSEIYRRLTVRNRTEAVAAGRRLGLIATS